MVVTSGSEVPQSFDLPPALVPTYNDVSVDVGGLSHVYIPVESSFISKVSVHPSSVSTLVRRSPRPSSADRDPHTRSGRSGKPYVYPQEFLFDFMSALDWSLISDTKRNYL